MRFGRGVCPEGFLPIFSVNTDDEAKRLIVATCSRGTDGEFYSNEMAANQTLAQFQVFGEKLARVYANYIANAPASGSSSSDSRPRRARARRH